MYYKRVILILAIWQKWQDVGNILVTHCNMKVTWVDQSILLNVRSMIGHISIHVVSTFFWYSGHHSSSGRKLYGYI